MENENPMRGRISEQLLFDYFAGKATALQKKVVAEWLSRPEHAETYYRLLCDYETRMTQVPPRPAPTVDDLEKRFLPVPADGDEKPAETPEARPFFTGRSSYLWVAALLLLIGGLGIFFFRLDPYRTYTTGFGQTRTVRLSDGSLVTLNANSSLRVPRSGFSEAFREVWVEGEAEFSVTHRADNQAFIVRTSSRLDVEVIGTVFTVFSRHRAAQVQLHQGKVRIKYATGTRHQPILMRPGDLVILDRQGKLRQQRTRRTDAFAAWKDHRFVFDETSVAEICQLIQDNFGVRVRPATKTLGARTITGDFQARTAEELLSVITEALDLRIHTENNTLFLDED